MKKGKKTKIIILLLMVIVDQKFTKINEKLKKKKNHMDLI